MLMAQSFRENLGTSVKLKIHINFKPVIPPWGFYPRELKVPIDKESGIFITALRVVRGARMRAHTRGPANNVKMSINTGVEQIAALGF